VDERRAQLLAAALEMFAQRAYDEVSVDEVARAVGVSKGLLYHYFPTKRDLYVGALRLAATRLLTETEIASASPSERVVASLQTLFDFVERHGPAYVALMRGGIGSDPEVADILAETRGTFTERVARDIPPELGTPLVRAALRGWIGFVEATSVEWAARRDVSRSELLALLLGVLVDTISRASGAPFMLFTGARAP
jgi:AcrR family transcriptional regulator